MLVLVLSLPFTSAEALSLVYDANGNLVSGDGLYREYNSLNQLSAVYNGSSASDPLLQTFIHHPVEERVLLKKTYNSTGDVIESVYYWSKSFVTVENETGMFNYTYVFHNGQRVAQELNGVKYFTHTDHLGSATVVSDESGNVVENSSYSPLGSIVEGGSETRFDYESKEFDSVVGDTDFHFRKYKADWGIFLQPDTLIPNVYDPQSLNRYMFERGNPYGNIDPDGHADLAVIISGTLTAVAGVLLLGALAVATAPVSVPVAIATVAIGIGSVGFGIGSALYGTTLDPSNEMESYGAELISTPVGFLTEVIAEKDASVQEKIKIAKGLNTGYDILTLLMKGPNHRWASYGNMITIVNTGVRYSSSSTSADDAYGKEPSTQSTTTSSIKKGGTKGYSNGVTDNNPTAKRLQKEYEERKQKDKN